MPRLLKTETFLAQDPNYRLQLITKSDLLGLRKIHDFFEYRIHDSIYTIFRNATVKSNFSDNNKITLPKIKQLFIPFEIKDEKYQALRKEYLKTNAPLNRMHCFDKCAILSSGATLKLKKENTG